MSFVELWSTFRSLFSPCREVVGRWQLECDLPSDGAYWVRSIHHFYQDGRYVEHYNRTITDPARCSLDDASYTKSGRYSLRGRVITILLDAQKESTTAWYIYSTSDSILALAHYNPSVEGDFEAMMADVNRYRANNNATLGDHFCICKRLD